MEKPAIRVAEIDLTTDGLDEIFDAEAEPIEQNIKQGANSPPTSHEHGAGMSLKAACKHYRLAASTLRAKIKSGEIPAEKVQGSNGPEWRIYPNWLRFEQPKRQSDTQGAATVTPGSQSEVNRLLDLIEKQAAKLEAAAGQIGYLTSQLEERDKALDKQEQKIKLLTDSQAKRGWWFRFSSWLWSKQDE
ncbi:MAG TPA: hypothetical protein V6C86_03585 [Oculatellaceae cyanobacterium]